MILRIYERGDVVRRLIRNGQMRGEVIHSSQLDTYSTFIIYEVFSFLNSNRMSISMVIFDREEHTDLHVVASGGGKGMIFRFDWGAGKGFEESIKQIFVNNNVRFQMVNH